MTFPVYIGRVHPHLLLEAIAYGLGLGTHLLIRRRQKQLGTEPEVERSLWAIAGAVLGALLGAKLLAWAEHFGALLEGFGSSGEGLGNGLERWIGGKTIVGGLIGGWIGVEVAKRCTGVRQRTGDTWVYPLIVSMAIGRVGCFLTGLSDQTYGIATELPWGVDFGDGVRRHPTQLYESLFLLGLGAVLAVYQRAQKLGFGTGQIFRLFMGAYCLWRFGVEFIKPRELLVLRLSAIQIASLVTAVISLRSFARMHFSPLTSEALGE